MIGGMLRGMLSWGVDADGDDVSDRGRCWG